MDRGGHVSAHPFLFDRVHLPPVSGQDQFIRSDRATRTCLTGVDFIFFRSLLTRVANRGSAEVSHCGHAKIFKCTLDQQLLFSIWHRRENITLRMMNDVAAFCP
jgi:hypothetical protein